MMLGPIAFLSPLLLAGLLALPLIWWLLRAVPPRPQRIAFPPTRILVGIENRERTPAKTPWWLTLIRMAAAALVILALAEPVLNPNRESALAGSGPVVLVIDNGWPAAAQWSHRSIELLKPENPGIGGLLDTLAHCYAAKKDYEKALEYQSQAIELEPHSGEIRRAYERFKKTAEEAKSKAQR